jgi:hypothetical protein
MWINDPEMILPERISIYSINSYDGGILTVIQMENADFQRIELTETLEPPSQQELARTNHIMDIAGVEMLQAIILEDDYVLYFQTMGRYISILGSDTGELISIARSILEFPGLDLGYDDIYDLPNMSLPRGLVTIVPIR